MWRTAKVNLWREVWDAAPHFDRVAELWEQARHSVIVVGWQLDSRIQLKKPGDSGLTETLRDKVLRLCEQNPRLHFYLLLWDHPVFYLPQREWLQTRIWEELHPRVHLVFDHQHPLGASHHEKLIIVDGRTALVGSVDLCKDRWDRPEHPPQDPGRQHGPYHELGIEIQGQACSELMEHIALRWSSLSSIPFPTGRFSQPADRLEVAPQSQFRVHLSRTLSGPDRPLIREIEFLFLHLISETRQRIWMEGQYFWSEKISQALLKKMKSHIQSGGENPLKITIILADNSLLRGLSSQMILHQTRCLQRLQSFARRHPRQIDLQIYRPFSGAHPIYVHSKILLVDHRWLSIGSANFSNRALRLDSEIMITLDASESRHIEGLWKKLSQHWSPPISLIRVDACTELELLTWSQPYWKRIIQSWPWHHWIDPSLPFFYRSQRRINAMLSRPTRRRSIQFLGSWSALLLSWSPALWYSQHQFSGAKLGLSMALSVALSSVWLHPFPWIAFAVTACILLGPSQSTAELLIVAWWSANLFSTSWGRIFPRLQRQWIKRKKRRLMTRFGTRRFISILASWLSAQDSVHSKMLSQSHYSTPIPWILWIHGVLAATVIALTLQIFEQGVRLFQ